MQSITVLDGPSDEELIAAVRGGDVDSYAVLFVRHVGSARRLAGQIAAPSEVDDLVSDAFARVLATLQRGGGPDLAFRAYLLTALRRLHVDRLRAAGRVRPTDDETTLDTGVAFSDTAVAGFESDTAARAFRSLPERWQLVLWHTEVEGQRPAEVAPLLGMSANSVAALAYRAREGLRQAFVSLHAQEAGDDACAAARAQLGAFIRGGSSRREAARVTTHLAACRGCTGIYLELVDINADLRGLLGPVVLGGAAAAYASSLAGGTAAGGALKAGLLLLLGRARDLVAGHAAASAVAGVTATAVVTGGVLAGIDRGGEPPVAEVPAALGPGSPSPSASTTDRPARSIVLAARPRPGATLRASAPAAGTTRESQAPPSPAVTTPSTPTPTSGGGGGGGPSGPTSAPTSAAPPSAPPSTAPTTTPPAPPATTHTPVTAPPTPVTPPAPAPPPSPAAPRTDMSVASSTQQITPRIHVVYVQVSGLAADQRGTLRLTSDTSALKVTFDRRCHTGYDLNTTCDVQGPTWFKFLAFPLQPGRTVLSFVGSPVAGLVDSNTANNASSQTIER